MAIIEVGRLGTRNRKFAGLILAGLGSVFAVGFAAIALGEAEGRLQVEIFDQATGQAVNARCYLTDAASKFWAPAGVPRLRLSLATRLLFDYIAHRRRLPQSAKQIQVGITSGAFYSNHGANAKSGKKQTRQFSHRSIKEYIRRIRRSLAVAFREAGLKFDPSAVLKSEETEGSRAVNYQLRASVEWIHFE
jgi:hypothetical protein